MAGTPGAFDLSPEQLEDQHRDHPRRAQDGADQKGEQVQGQGDAGNETGEINCPHGGKAHGCRDSGCPNGPAHPDQEGQDQEPDDQQTSDHRIGGYPIVSATSSW